MELELIFEWVATYAGEYSIEAGSVLAVAFAAALIAVRLLRGREKPPKEGP